MEADSRGSKEPLGDYTRDVNEASWAGGQGRGQKEWAEDEAEKKFLRPRPQCMRPRPDTLENNSVCMSMKTKILAFRK